jgi:hypothetical protein
LECPDGWKRFMESLARMRLTARIIVVVLALVLALFVVATIVARFATSGGEHTDPARTEQVTTTK